MPATANQVRIIGGRHRGRRVHFTPVRGLRPTPDRVRETLFNWLQHDIAGTRCLDLFAGSGALGLEALSRGAAWVTFVEQARVAVTQLHDNLALLGEQGRTEVIQRDAQRLLATPPARPFDVVFLDPPFADGLLPQVCAALEAGGWLGGDAWIYLEQDAATPWPQPPSSWTLHRQGRAGQSAHCLLRRSMTG